MAINTNAIKGKLRAIGNRILVSDMEFGEQVTRGGIIISSDDGKARGVYPRWGKVYAKGPANKDEYKVGDWILITHGRWTRGMLIDDDGQEFTLRMVEAESVLAYSDENPTDVSIGQEFSNGPAEIRPESFMN